MPSPARHPRPDGPGRQPEVWAVLVGIDLYNDPAIPRCHGANRDGGELARWLTETAHWDRRHVLLMNEFGLRRHGRPEDHDRRPHAHPREHELGLDAVARPPRPARRPRSRLLRRPSGRRGRPDPALADRCPGRRPRAFRLVSRGGRRRARDAAGLRVRLLARHLAVRAAFARPPDRAGPVRRGPPSEPTQPMAGGDGLARRRRPARGGGPATRALPLRPGQRARRPSEQPGRMPRPYVRRPDPEEAGVPGPGGHLSPGDPLAGLVPARASVPAGTAPASGTRGRGDGRRDVGRRRADDHRVARFHRPDLARPRSGPGPAPRPPLSHGRRDRPGAEPRRPLRRQRRRQGTGARLGPG